MAVLLWLAVALSLHLQGCIGYTETGCMKWKQSGDNVCCETCHPGHRLVTSCGQNPSKLCTLCEADTYTLKPKDYECTPCTQCIGLQVLEKKCTATSDTVCGCKEGYLCGDKRCSFCITKCGKGEEPTEDRDCRPCPEGTFNDQIHEPCKPHKTKCPNPAQHIVSYGNASSDILCTNVANVSRTALPNPMPDDREEWPLVLSIVTSVALIGVSLIIIITVGIKILQMRKKTDESKKSPIISTPTDDPQTLIAIECSFHEAQQEQGSSTESLDSKDSSYHLIA